MESIIFLLKNTLQEKDQLSLALLGGGFEMILDSMECKNKDLIV